MKKIILIILILVISIGCSNIKFRNNNNITDLNESDYKPMDEIKINIVVNNEELNASLYDNETSRSLLSKMPLTIIMNDLNENEKYSYLNFKLPVNEYNPKIINSGDIMLYGDNCLVIFYKTFNTSYNYTKIGRVDDLEKLENIIYSSTFSEITLKES